MGNTLLDNTFNLKMVDTLKQRITDDCCRTIKIATGYWDIPGLALVKDELRIFLNREDTELKLLIGTDPYVRISQLKNPVSKDAKFPDDYIRRDIQELEVTEQYEDAVRLILDFCLEEEDISKVKIRIYRQDDEGDAQFLHAKCYIFLGSNSYGIIGSSNFTQKGLEGNAELNFLETTSSIVLSTPNEYNPDKGHNCWFEEKWELGKPWNKTFLEQIIKPSPNAVSVINETNKLQPLTPYELYIKLLHEKFGVIVDRNLSGVLESYLPDNYMPLEYQMDAAKQCFAIMHEHGGFMLGDVVGLGKTIVGVLLVKYFLSVPDDDGRERRVLIITPPAIKTAWLDTIAEFEKDKEKFSDRVDFITTGSISKLVDDVEDENDTDDETEDGDFSSALKSENYGLIMIDESHKFKSSSTSMYKALDELISNIGAEVGVYPYVGLLSATPQNNTPDDIRNQIYLFERNHKDCSLKKADGGNIESFFAEKRRAYDDIIRSHEEPKERQKKLIALSVDIREKVLNDILVRRTRTDVKKYYEEDMSAQGLHFPDIQGPVKLEYKMSAKLAARFAYSMEVISQNIGENRDEPFIGYFRYRAIEFIKDTALKDIYKGKNMNPERFSHQLARIMQINLVKRLESSFTAFKASLENLRRYTRNMIDMWENDTIFICPNIDVNEELRLDKNNTPTTFENCIEDIRTKIKRLNDEGRNEKGRNRELRKSDFETQYIDSLRLDYEIICTLCKEWNTTAVDPKLQVFQQSLQPYLLNPETNPSGKLVIFTEAIDTQRALVEVIEGMDFKVLEITSKNRKEKESTIKENFDANYKGEWKNDYDIIVTTDVLAEGINLHRANCILNYDTPWNSTRLMQRIGRVNRVGSTAPCVYVYNFMPSAEGDEQIALVQKAHTKLQSFHTLFGEDSQIFSEAEEVTHYDLRKFVDGDESPLQKYIHELREFKENNPGRYQFISECDADLQQAIENADGNAYFWVRIPRFTGMFVKVDIDHRPYIIATTDMLEAFRPNASAVSAPLPENWKDLCKIAELKVNQELTKISTSAKNSKRADEAKAIIKRLGEDTPNITEKTKATLGTAFSLVRKGNPDIIKHIIALNKYLDNQQPALFDVTQEDINDIIQSKLQSIIKTARERHGEAYTKIALLK